MARQGRRESPRAIDDGAAVASLSHRAVRSAASRVRSAQPRIGDHGSHPTRPQRSIEKKWLWAWQWFEHQNIRDERVEAFTSLLWEGVYNYSYAARATTPGVFVVPPSKAEEMYHPETFEPKPSGRILRAESFGPNPSGAGRLIA